MDSKEKYIQLYQQMADLCDREGWGDPFSYARSTKCPDPLITLAQMP